MNLFVGVRAALSGDHEELPTRAADADEPPPPADLRCHNPECDLYLLRLEADEVAATPGSQPDRCASCGQQLRPFTDATE